MTCDGSGPSQAGSSWARPWRSSHGPHLFCGHMWRPGTSQSSNSGAAKAGPTSVNVVTTTVTFIEHWLCACPQAKTLPTPFYIFFPSNWTALLLFTGLKKWEYPILLLTILSLNSIFCMTFVTLWNWFISSLSLSLKLCAIRNLCLIYFQLNPKLNFLSPGGQVTLHISVPPFPGLQHGYDTNS